MLFYFCEVKVLSHSRKSTNICLELLDRTALSKRCSKWTGKASSNPNPNFPWSETTFRKMLKTKYTYKYICIFV